MQDKEQEEEYEQVTPRVSLESDFVKEIRQESIAVHQAEANEQHYEVRETHCMRTTTSPRPPLLDDDHCTITTFARLPALHDEHLVPDILELTSAQVPAEFFRIVLGPKLKYSCGLFKSVPSLAPAPDWIQGYITCITTFASLPPIFTPALLSCLFPSSSLQFQSILPQSQTILLSVESSNNVQSLECSLQNIMCSVQWVL